MGDEDLRCGARGAARLVYLIASLAALVAMAISVSAWWKQGSA